MPAPIRAVVTCLFLSTALIPAVGRSAEVAPDADPCGGTRGSMDAVTVPSLEHRTLQSGVCAVQDGGTVRVLPGVYMERVTIWGKHVELRGRGSEQHGWPVLQAASPAEIMPAGEAVGVVSVRAGGSLTGRMLTLVGGDAGILVDQVSGPVDVRHVRLERNGRGILHLSPEDLTVKHAIFVDQSWNGISFAPPQVGTPAAKLLVTNTNVLLADNICIFAQNALVWIHDTSYSFCEGGGVAVDASLFTVSNVKISSVQKFGFLNLNSVGTIDHTNISSTSAGSGGFLGDAVVSWTDGSGAGAKPAMTHLGHVSTEGSARVAVSSFGAYVSFENCTFECQAFDVFGADNDGFGYVFDNFEETACGCPDAEGPCDIETEGVEPPEMIGGIEE